MPKKKDKLTQAEQSERFRKAVLDLARAGELDPTEAEERFELAMNKIAKITPTRGEPT